MIEIILKVDKQKFDLILAGLGKLPAEIVYNLITDLYNQYQQQQVKEHESSDKKDV